VTKWTESPLRPPNQPWPGLNTKGGILDNGTGQMSDCTNVIINRNDLLEKRKGIVRALDERFGGPVCGLFKYTDKCGIESLIVADETAISIRAPYVVPVGVQADCYPGDSFALEDGEDLSSSTWNNAGLYEVQDDKMVLRASSPAVSDDNTLYRTLAARWFKDACSPSYQVRVSYEFADIASVTQRVFLIIKGTSVDLTNGAYILGLLEFRKDEIYRFQILHQSASNNIDVLHTEDVTGQRTGFFTVKFSQAQGNKAGAAIAVTGGTNADVFAAKIFNEAELNNLGLISALGMAEIGGKVSQTFGQLVVDGGSID
jgi:hypothetical protein